MEEERRFDKVNRWHLILIGKQQWLKITNSEAMPDLLHEMFVLQ